MPNAEQEKQDLYRAYLHNRKQLDEKASADRRLSTYLAMAVAASEDIGGRYKHVAPMTIVGATPVPQYPRQPEGSPWSQQWPDGPDVYGVPIDAQEPVGEQFEIEAAQKILDERSAGSASTADGSSAVVPASASLSVERAELPTNNSSALSAPAMSVMSSTGAAVGGETDAPASKSALKPGTGASPIRRRL
jgi:hypothetical protein